MPRLLLLRHAKSDWSDETIEDIDRPLNGRGRRDAARIADLIVAHGLAPEKILCSAARRTRETLAAMLPTFEAESCIRLTPDLYLAEEDRIIDQIRAHGGNARTVLVIGHNPGLQQTILALAGDGDPVLRTEVQVKFPTATLAIIDFPAVKWVDVEPARGRLVALLRPGRRRPLAELPATDDI